MYVVVCMYVCVRVCCQLYSMSSRSVAITIRFYFFACGAIFIANAKNRKWNTSHTNYPPLNLRPSQVLMCPQLGWRTRVLLALHLAKDKDPNQQFVNCTLFKTFCFLTKEMIGVTSDNRMKLKKDLITYVDKPTPTHVLVLGWWWRLRSY